MEGRPVPDLRNDLTGPTFVSICVLPFMEGRRSQGAKVKGIGTEFQYASFLSWKDGGARRGAPTCRRACFNMRPSFHGRTASSACVGVASHVASSFQYASFLSWKDGRGRLDLDGHGCGQVSICVLPFMEGRLASPPVPSDLHSVSICVLPFMEGRPRSRLRPGAMSESFNMRPSFHGRTARFSARPWTTKMPFQYASFLSWKDGRETTVWTGSEDQFQYASFLSWKDGMSPVPAIDATCWFQYASFLSWKDGWKALMEEPEEPEFQYASFHERKDGESSRASTGP